VLIGARQAAEIGTLSRTGAGDEKSHATLLFLRTGNPVQGYQGYYDH
jgi:hypothetical protein